MRLDIANGFHLTELRRSDEDAVVACLNDKDYYDRLSRVPYPYTADDFQGWCKVNDEATRLNGEPVLWAIRDPDGTMVGAIGLEGVVVGKSHRCELGYWLAKRCQGQGIMTAAVRAVCRHAFANLGLVKIAAHVFAFNDPSARLLERCGFRLEGYLRKQFKKDGKLIDSKLYSLESE